MTTITLESPINIKNTSEYKQIFSYFLTEYSLDELKKIKEKKIYMKMLDGVFNNEEEFNELEINDGKIDFTNLLK